MVTAACMQRSLERGAFESSLWIRHVDDGDDAAARAAAIDDVMRAAERAESWPRFINVLRARGPELREHMLRLVESSARREAGFGGHRRPLLARLADVGLAEELRDLLDHAQRSMAQARGVGYLLDERDPDDVPRFPNVREHALQGENAAWMHTFARVLLVRVAAGVTAIERPSTEFAVTLAAEAARDAYAHWATALELLADAEAA